jgi:hypothetical protein
MRCFALISKEIAVDRQKFLDYLDVLPDIANWRATSGAIFIVTEKDEDWLVKTLRLKFPKITYMVIPVRINEVQGYQDAETWDFIRDPRPVDVRPFRAPDQKK